MSSRRIKVAKYYRLSAKHNVETENVSVEIDYSSPKMTVFCEEKVREEVPIHSDKSKFPKIMLRDIHTYIMFSGSSSDGFRLSFDELEKEEFVKILTSMGFASDGPASHVSTTSSERSYKRDVPERTEYGGSKSQGDEIVTPRPAPPPRFTQQPTPSPHQFTPTVRRDSTLYMSKSPRDYHQYLPNPPSQLSQSSSLSQRLDSRHSQNSNFDVGESVPAKRMRLSSDSSNKIISRADKSIQTDDIVDTLLEDTEFTQKVLLHLTKQRGFAKLVGSMTQKLKKMSSVEKSRLQWKTNPTLTQKMPPPVIRLPTSEMED